jgi:hypothetical protein
MAQIPFLAMGQASKILMLVVVVVVVVIQIHLLVMGYQVVLGAVARLLILVLLALEAVECQVKETLVV